MNIKMNILTLLILLILIVIMFTGSYIVDVKAMEGSIGKYQENHEIKEEAHIKFVEGSIINRKKKDEEETLKAEDNIKHTGVYYTSLNTYYKYIKFIKGNGVITFTTNCTPQEVMQWKKEQLEGAPEGTYYIKDDNIYFTTSQKKPEGHSVKVKYEGEKQENQLFLHSYSEATKNKTDLVYKYYE